MKLHFGGLQWNFFYIFFVYMRGEMKYLKYNFISGVVIKNRPEKNLFPYSFLFKLIIHTQKELMSFDNNLYVTRAKCVKPINIILYFHNKTQLTVNQTILDMRRNVHFQRAKWKFVFTWENRQKPMGEMSFISLTEMKSTPKWNSFRPKREKSCKR